MCFSAGCSGAYFQVAILVIWKDEAEGCPEFENSLGNISKAKY